MSPRWTQNDNTDGILSPPFSSDRAVDHHNHLDGEANTTNGSRPTVHDAFYPADNSGEGHAEQHLRVPSVYSPLISRLASASAPSLSLVHPQHYYPAEPPFAGAEGFNAESPLAPPDQLQVVPLRWFEPRPSYPSSSTITSSDTVPDRPKQPFKIPPEKGKHKYPCPHCELVFSRASAFKQHFLSHSGEQPHECSACGRRFSLLSNLKRHRRTCKLLQQDMQAQSQPTLAQEWSALNPAELASLHSLSTTPGFSSLPNTPTSFLAAQPLPSASQIISMPSSSFEPHHSDTVTRTYGAHHPEQD